MQEKTFVLGRRTSAQVQEQQFWQKEPEVKRSH